MADNPIPPATPEDLALDLRAVWERAEALLEFSPDGSAYWTADPEDMDTWIGETALQALRLVGHWRREAEELGARTVLINSWGAELCDALGKFLQTVIDEKAPKTTQIRISTPDADVPGLFLWATVDETSPINRCRDLAKARFDADDRATAAESEAARLRERVRELEGIVNERVSLLCEWRDQSGKQCYSPTDGPYRQCERHR